MKQGDDEIKLSGKTIRKIKILSVEESDTEIIEASFDNYRVWITARKDGTSRIDVHCHNNRTLPPVKKGTKHQEYDGTKWRKTIITDGVLNINISDFK